jgi:L-aspartate oxidase
MVGLMMAVAALRREESVGAHYRTDFPEAPATRRRSTLSLGEALNEARNLVARPVERQSERSLEPSLTSG